MKKKYYLAISILFLMFHLSVITGQAGTVTSKNDSGPGSLRQAILDANPGDTIVFAANVRGSILLTQELVLDKDLTIIGPGANVLGIEGHAAPGECRVFNSVSGEATISGLRISNGFQSSGAGGGVRVAGFLTLNNCLVFGNKAASGGGILVSMGTLIVTNSAIIGNIAQINGGGVSNSGSLILINSTIAENQAHYGGGVANSSGNLDIVNCTISFNGNPNPVAGNIGGLANLNNRLIRLTNTIIAKNIGSPTAPADVGGQVISQGNNLIGDTAGGFGFAASDLQNVNPRLGGLANNGGATYTHSLLPISPAINAGNNANAPATDQRGVARPQGGTVDIGAYEFGVRPAAFGKIAFVSDRDGNEEIYSMDADGSNQVRLTNNSAFDHDPDWSPDGANIAFSTARAGNSEIYVMSDTGSSLMNLTSSAAYEFDPAWSPDGQRIAYSRTTSIFANDYEIWVMDSNGGNQTQLTNTAGQGRAPSWSPDGTQIVFTSFPGGTNSIDVMNADGTNRRSITVGDGAGVNLPAWSPDGNRIAYNNDVSGQYIYLANPSDTITSPLRPLFATNTLQASAPAWSPDGAKLAYYNSSTSDRGLYIVDADGTNPVLLVASTTTVFNEFPDWFGFNTSIGSNIAVDLGTVDLNFSSITGPGTTTATPIDPASVGTLPGGYSLGAGFPAYEITTTASYTAPITVCLQVPSATDSTVFSALRILHNEGGTVLDQTILPPDTPAPDFAAKTICARVNSLSPFVVAQSTATPAPTPTIVAAGATLVNESCATNSQIDPGERVTVNLKLMNSGGASTTNLIATLQSSDGVVAPTGPQVYGVVAPAEMRGLDFSFTAGPTLTPGQPIALTLQLQDGPTGNPTPISFEFIAGSSPCGGVRLVVTSTTLQRSGGMITTLVTVQNVGTLPADQVILIAAMLGLANGTAAPSNLGTINIGASSSAQVSFTTAATGSSLLKFSGTYGPGVSGSGSFNSTKRVTIP